MHRIHFFEKIAPHYDLLLDTLTVGQYRSFLKKAVRILSPQKGEKILDLCSGTGRVASWLAEAVGKEGRVVGMDLSRGMIEVAERRYGNSENLLFLRRDVTKPWGYQDYFDRIFMSFCLHELPESHRSDVLKQSHMALKEKGKMVIADFNPQVSRIGKHFSLLFFNLIERRNLNFFGFNQNEALNGAGFKKVRTLLIAGDILQITFAQK